MLSIILIVIITVVTLVLVLAAGKPDQFRVQRSISIDAPAARVFASIDSFSSLEHLVPVGKNGSGHAANAQRRRQRQGRRL